MKAFCAQMTAFCAIIAERVYVGRDIRKKKKQESGNQNYHTSNAIEHNEFNIKHPLENKLPEHNSPNFFNRCR
jgi:hypothetical protein